MLLGSWVHVIYLYTCFLIWTVNFLRAWSSPPPTHHLVMIALHTQ